MVDVKTGLMLAHLHSGASPSVHPTFGIKLKEKEVWQDATWVGRWNLGTKKITFLPSRLTWRWWGKVDMCSQRWMLHWQTILYDITSSMKSVTNKPFKYK